MLIGAMILSIIIGFASCLFGHKLFKIYLVVLGALVGAGVTAIFSSSLWLILLMAAAGALLFHFIFLLGVAVLGFITGYSLSLGLFQLIGVTVFPELFFLIGIICAVLACKFNHVFIILGTSFSGASQVVQGIFGLISCKTLEEFYALQESSYTPAGKGELAVLLLIFALAIVGAIFQFKGMSAKDKKRIR